LIRFVELSLHLSSRQSISYLREQLAPSAQPLDHTAAFYQLQLSGHPEAVHYLLQRGLCDPAVIEELDIGYAPGGTLRSHLSDLIRARSEFRIAKGEREQVRRAAGAVAKRAFLGHLYRNCTRLRLFQRLLRLLRHAKSITCVDAIWLRGSNPTLSAGNPLS
jgi:hypothetical protein